MESQWSYISQTSLILVLCISGLSIIEATRLASTTYFDQLERSSEQGSGSLRMVRAAPGIQCRVEKQRIPSEFVEDWFDRIIHLQDETAVHFVNFLDHFEYTITEYDVGNVTRISDEDLLVIRQLKFSKNDFQGINMRITSGNVEFSVPGNSNFSTDESPRLELSMPSTLKDQCKGEEIVLNIAAQHPSKASRYLAEGYIVSDVMTLSVRNESIRNLSEPFRVRYYMNQTQKVNLRVSPTNATVSEISVMDLNHSCVWWDVKNYRWSDYECTTNRTVIRRQLRIECSCTHFTSFAVLVTGYSVKTVDGSNVLSDRHLEIQEILTYICIGMSMLSVIFAMLIFICDRSLRRIQNQRIMFHLNLSLLLSYIMFFLVSVNDIKRHDAACKAVGVIYHYFLLTTFGWMLVSAVNMYLALVKVFNTYIKRFMLKASLLCWGLPTLPPVILLIIDGKDHSFYKHPLGICFVHGMGMYMSFLVPLTLVVIVNLCLFTLCLRALRTVSATKIKIVSQNATDLKFIIATGICLSVLLGGTWLLAWPVSLITQSMSTNTTGIQQNSSHSVAYTVFSYVFIVFNAVQGLLIFAVHFLRPALKKSSICAKLKSTVDSDKYETTKTASNTRIVVESLSE